MMKFNINKEMVRTVGVVAGKIGKAIIIEGIKGVLLKSATNVITTSFDGGVEGVKNMTIDDYVGKKKKKDVFAKVTFKQENGKVVPVDNEDLYTVLEFRDKLQKAADESKKTEEN